AASHYTFTKGGHPMTRTAVAAALAAAVFAGAAQAQSTFKIGELNSYKSQPAFLEPYRRGWEMALEEINARGGVLGRKLEVVSRDDGGNPGDAVRVAEELVSREGVSLLAGTFLSHLGLAVTEFAKQKQPDIEFVTEQATPLGKVEAGPVVQALADARADGIFNVLFGADLSRFVREGTTRGLFKEKTVVSLLSGEPEYLDPLKDEAPQGWI